MGIFTVDFGSFSGNSQEMLAPLPFRATRRLAALRPDARLQDGEIVEQVGTLSDHGVGLAIDGVDHDLDGFFGQFFRHFGGAAPLKQPAMPFAKLPDRDRLAAIIAR